MPIAVAQSDGRLRLRRVEDTTTIVIADVVVEAPKYSVGTLVNSPTIAWKFEPLFSP